MAHMLVDALQILEERAQERAREPWLESLGRSAFDLEGEALSVWCARAWWGRAASEAVYLRLLAGRAHEVEAVTEPWAPQAVVQDVDAGRGLVVCGSHLGPRRHVRWQCERCFPDLMVLAAARPRTGARGVVDAGDPHERSLFVTRAVRALRAGGVVLAAPDGRQGSASAQFHFLRRPVQMRLGLARIISLSGAASAAIAAVWEGHRIRTLIRRLPAAPPIRRPAPQWELAWCRHYIQWLEELCAMDAANMRLAGGFWTRGGGGLRPRSPPRRGSA